MDEQLAAIYGTNQVTETEDQEKLAAAELLVKLAEDEGVDLDQFNDEEIAEMVNEIYGASAEGGEEKIAEDESQEKLAEADFLGRVMAHAYAQEMREIEKQAADEVQGPKIGKLRLLKRRAESALAPAAKRVGEWTGASAIHAGHKTSREAAQEAAKIKGMAVPASAKDATEKALQELAHKGAAGKKQLMAGLKRMGVRVGAPLAAVGGTAALVHHLRKEKKGSADLDKLAEDHAMRMLLEQGWIDEQGNLLHDPQQVKEAEAEVELTPEQAVEIRALQMLEENGFPVTWNE